jgi:hypothetical protein
MTFPGSPPLNSRSRADISIFVVRCSQYWRSPQMRCETARPARVEMTHRSRESAWPNRDANDTAETCPDRQRHADAAFQTRLSALRQHRLFWRQKLATVGALIRQERRSESRRPPDRRIDLIIFAFKWRSHQSDGKFTATAGGQCSGRPTGGHR